jgi:Ser/Thr protein kinase RdoA (MazF antagonist)
MVHNPVRELLDVVDRLVGPAQPVADHSWPSTSAQVWRIRTHDGQELIAKHNTDNVCFQREHHALAHWAPALRGGAPRLVAAHSDAQILVLTALPGVPLQQLRPDPVTERRVYQRAGRLLHLLHEAEPAAPLPDFVGTRTAYIQGLLSSGGYLLTKEERSLTELALRHMAQLPIMDGYPSHLDCTPRNLLADKATGAVHLIDFETSRLEIKGRDFNRMASRVFPTRPDLKEAFFTGYGRQPTNDEKAVMAICGAVDAASALIWARSNNHRTFATEAHASLYRLARHLLP